MRREKLINTLNKTNKSHKDNHIPDLNNLNKCLNKKKRGNKTCNLL